LLSKRKAEQIVASLSQTKSVAVSDHFKKRLFQLGYSIQDAYRVLRTGHVERPQRWNDDYQNYEVRVRGRAYDNRDTRVVLGVTAAGTAVFATIVEVGRRKR